MFEKFFNSPRNVYFRHNFVITFENQRKKDFFPLRTKSFPGFVSCIFFFSRFLLLPCRICVAQDFLRPPFSGRAVFLARGGTPSTPGAARRKIRSATAEPECDVPSRSLRNAPFSTPHHRLSLRMPCGIRRPPFATRSSPRNAGTLPPSIPDPACLPAPPSQRPFSTPHHRLPLRMPCGIRPPFATRGRPPSRRPPLRPSARQRRARPAVAPPGAAVRNAGAQKDAGISFLSVLS